MNTTHLKIDLLEPCSFSVFSSTTGGHQSWDRIPGSALLGLAASHLYGKSSSFDDWIAFHSGHIRFGDGFPTSSNGEIAYPMPICLHAEKSKSHLIDAPIVNVALADQDKGTQYVQLRGGYLTATGMKVSVGTDHFLKTAISPETGTARTGMLFETHRILSGQSFIAAINYDDAVKSEFEQIIAVLAGSKNDTVKRHRIGRSRSAEHGLVQIQRVEVKSQMHNPSIRTKTPLLWAISDIAVPEFDEKGYPRFGEIERAGFEIDAKRSNIRYRRFAVFNGFWRKSAPEIICISAGSVICLKPTDHNKPCGPLPGFIGKNQESGFGAISIDPHLLSQSEVKIKYLPKRSDHSVSETPPPDNALAEFMIAQYEARTNTTNSSKLAKEVAEKFKDAYESAIDYTGRSDTKLGAPGKTQWNLIASEAKSAENWSAFKDHILSDQGPVSEQDKVWRIAYNPGKNFRTLLQEHLEIFSQRQDIDPLKTLVLVCEEMVVYFENSHNRDNRRA